MINTFFLKREELHKGLSYTRRRAIQGEELYKSLSINLRQQMKGEVYSLSQKPRNYFFYYYYSQLEQCGCENKNLSTITVDLWNNTK